MTQRIVITKIQFKFETVVSQSAYQPAAAPHQLPFLQEPENKKNKFFLFPLENLSCLTNTQLKTKKIQSKLEENSDRQIEMMTSPKLTLLT